MDRRDFDFTPQYELLDRLTRGADRWASIASLRRYFRQDGPEHELFTGRWFDLFDGGSAPATANVITAGDVLALTHLSLSNNLSPLAIAVLDRRAADITQLLANIPLVALHEVPSETYEAVLGRRSAAWKLWELLRTCTGGNRWVAANKLLARKRPHLLPVYDNVVRDGLGQPADVWACLWSWFDRDPDRVTAVEELRAEADGIDDISLLRCLDVVLWMRDEEGRSGATIRSSTAFASRGHQGYI